MPGHSWTVTFDGHPATSTDDLTLDEVALAERVAGVPWSTMNPLGNVKVAKALFVLTAIRAGMPEAQALEAAGSTPLKRLHGAFTLVMGDVTAPGEGGDDPPPSAPTSAGG